MVILQIEIYAHLHTSYTNEGERFVIDLNPDGYNGRRGVEDPRPVSEAAVERFERVLQMPPVLEPDPGWPGQLGRWLEIPLYLTRAHLSDGRSRQFRTESSHYLMLPWQEGDVAHYNPELSLAIAALMPKNFLNRKYLLAGHPPLPEEQLRNHEKFAQALQNREPRIPTPEGPLARAIENTDLERVKKLLALRNRPTKELLNYARKYLLLHQIEREALVQIQSALTPRQREDWDRAFRPMESLVRGFPAPPSLAERAARIVDLLERNSGLQK
jgi:hypothetical protein